MELRWYIIPGGWARAADDGHTYALDASGKLIRSTMTVLEVESEGWRVSEDEARTSNAQAGRRKSA